MLIQQIGKKQPSPEYLAMLDAVIVERGIKDTTVQVSLTPKKSPALKILLNADKKGLRPAIRKYFESGESTLILTGLTNEQRMAIKNSCESLVKLGYLVKLPCQKQGFIVGYKRTGQDWHEKEIKPKVKKLTKVERLANEMLTKLEKEGRFVREDFDVPPHTFNMALKLVEGNLEGRDKFLYRDWYRTGKRAGKAIGFYEAREK